MFNWLCWMYFCPELLSLLLGEAKNILAYVHKNNTWGVFPTINASHGRGIMCSMNRKTDEPYKGSNLEPPALCPLHEQHQNDSSTDTEYS
jgi:hypothetical protein